MPYYLGDLQRDPNFENYLHFDRRMRQTPELAQGCDRCVHGRTRAAHHWVVGRVIVSHNLSHGSGTFTIVRGKLTIAPRMFNQRNWQNMSAKKKKTRAVNGKPMAKGRCLPGCVGWHVQGPSGLPGSPLCRHLQDLRPWPLVH